ncbi:phosphoribosylformylglycinamidine synthase subunit PurS [Calderihabitans maritimus]|uniref:Phosphoribosylformylglycinamidine synthase subunit PurS n=1 Tax=Calderihabitans maritimus TaxID=1246530 RepID=A0A1Z5HSB3_9FIRM|nr:phosphoribosylformylglycinamidine synthase subunit PurS [Calderihabitans maritimus]GAW92170.1 phosphoribosylformylglycinamidine synthase PurS [Calderihabitans maritimus]
MFYGKIYVTLKKGVLDPQGSTVQRSLHALGYSNVAEVRIGKFMEVKLDSSSREEAARQLDEMCRRLLANPVIEDYTFEVTEV